MTENTDKNLGTIFDTVHDIKIELNDLTHEQKATNKSVDDLCKSLDRYSVGTEQRLSQVESDLGNRIPDDPTAFSQVQTLQSRTRRHENFIKSTWAFLSALVLLVVSQIFGWIKGH